MNRLLLTLTCALAVVATSGAVAEAAPAPMKAPTVSPRTDVPGVGFYSTPPATVFLEPNGSGSACTAAAPCQTLGAAFKVIGKGSGVVQAAAGNYAAENLTSTTPASSVGPVTVRPAPGAVATWAMLKIGRPLVTLDHLSFTGALYVYPNATMTTVNRVHVFGEGATVLLRSTYGRVANSLIEGGWAHDGINVAGVGTHDNVVEDNIVRNFTEKTSSDEHADCLQIYDTTRLIVRRNMLTNCYNSGITFSPGNPTLPISDVLIDSNFITGCMSELQRCGAGSAVDLREPVSNVTVVNNSIGRGSTRMPYQPGVSAPSNIIGYLSMTDCSTSLTNSMVAAYTDWQCTSLPGTNVGNYVGAANFVDPVNGNLHLAGTAKSAPVTGVQRLQMRKVTGRAVSRALSTALTVDVDYDGTPFQPGTVGADQP